jgi:hypothetical protein
MEKTHHLFGKNEWERDLAIDDVYIHHKLITSVLQATLK